METKVCSRCKVAKFLECFPRDKNRRDGRHPRCKECENRRIKAFRATNRGRENARVKAWEQANPDHVKNRRKAWREKNGKRIAARDAAWREANKERIIATSAAYRARKRDDRLAYNRSYRKRAQTDLNFRLQNALRGRLYKAIRNGQKTGSAVRDLGCTIEELKGHLERQFQPGMTWDNWAHDSWHIDHIIPLSSFDLTNRDELLKAVHYTNLQPLWADENLRKSNKLAA